MVRFLDHMNRQMRALRETSALPRSAVTLPDEFDDVVAGLTNVMRAQAEQAEAHGETLVEVRLPYSPGLDALARWSEPRMDLLAGLTRAGMVQPEWEGPLKLVTEIFEAVLGQLPDDADPTEQTATR